MLYRCQQCKKTFDTYLQAPLMMHVKNCAAGKASGSKVEQNSSPTSNAEGTGGALQIATGIAAEAENISRVEDAIGKYFPSA